MEGIFFFYDKRPRASCFYFCVGKKVRNDGLPYTRCLSLPMTEGENTLYKIRIKTSIILSEGAFDPCYAVTCMLVCIAPGGLIWDEVEFRDSRFGTNDLTVENSVRISSVFSLLISLVDTKASSVTLTYRRHQARNARYVDYAASPFVSHHASCHSLCHQEWPHQVRIQHLPKIER